MESLDGIAELHMSGARAVFVVEDGTTLDREDVAAAFDGVGMKLESLETVERPRAKAVWKVDAAIT